MSDFEGKFYNVSGYARKTSNASDFESEAQQSVGFYIKIFTSCQILKKNARILSDVESKIYNCSDFESKCYNEWNVDSKDLQRVTL